MNNLLPSYVGRADAPSESFTKLSSWKPEQADARNPKNVPYGLGVDLADELFEKKYLANEPAQSDHNHRNLKAIHDVDPSPLSFSQRGEAEVSHIAMPKLPEESTTTLMNRARKVPKELPLLLSVSNLHENVCIDLFMQRAGGVRDFVLQPDMQCTRNLSSFASAAQDGVESGPPMSVLLATVERVSVTVTFRHELRSFDFQPGPIGMEVEYKFGRLLCTNVLSRSQASQYADLLDNAEVVAVNGRRVISLPNFQQAVVDAHSFGRVTITAACYKRGKDKLDKFYEQISGSRHSKAKSLFSGLLAGLDAQHDVAGALSVTTKDTEDDDGTIPSARVGEEEEEEEEGGGVSRTDEQRGKEKVKDMRHVADAKDVYYPPHPGSRGEESGFSSKEGSRPATSQSKYTSEDSDDSDTDNITSIRKHKPNVPSSNSNKLQAKQQQAKSSYDSKGLADDEDEDGGMMVSHRSERKLHEEEEEEEEGLGGHSFEQQLSLDASEEGSAAIMSGFEVISAACNVEAGDANDAESFEEWDYTTHLDVEEAVPFSRILCVPQLFQKSGYWGNPDNFIQIINFSSKWDVNVCWVDEEGGVVPRALLKANSSLCRHMELTSTRHVWCLIATRAVDPNAAKDKEDEEAVAEEESTGPKVQQNKSSVVMLLRCSRASLQPRKYASMIWAPWQSVSATQRMRAKALPAHKKLKKQGNELQPDCVVQIMDGRVM